MTDNFDKLRQYCSTTPGSFYFVSVVQRKKDTGSNRAIKHYWLTCKDDFMKHKDEIVTLCKATNARAYIDPRPKSFEEYALEMNEHLASRLKEKSFNKINRISAHCAGTCKSFGPKIWMLDIDDGDNYDDVLDWIWSSKLTTVYLNVSSKSGHHMLVTPFDKREFPFRKDMIMDSCNVLLYCE